MRSVCGLGDAANPTPFEQTLPAILKTAQSVLSSDDAYENEAVIRAKIENLKRMREKIPVLAVFYTNEINKLQAKLSVASRQTALQREGEQATRDWRTVGYAAGIGVTLVAVAAAVRLLRGSK